MGVMEGMKELLNYFVSSKEEVLSLLIEHIELTVLALLAAILIGVPLGILISYIRQQAGAGLRQHCSGSAKHGAVRSGYPRVWNRYEAGYLSGSDLLSASDYQEYLRGAYEY